MPETRDTLPPPCHWKVVRRAISLIDEAGGQPVPVARLAREVDLSPHDLQRLFARWVGISPERYQECLAPSATRRLLRERFTTPEPPRAARRSGTGRPDEPAIRWEAMPPGLWAAGGAGLEIAWGRFESPFGEVIAAGSDRGLAGLAFAAETGPEAALADLVRRWPAARLVEAPGRLAHWMAAAFGEPRRPVPIAPLGPPFHLKVWAALVSVPKGTVTTYAALARAVGRPGAARAVGTAVGNNPIALLIPCHRVLRSDGGLGGYHWGLAVKRALLAREAAQSRSRHDSADPAGGIREPLPCPVHAPRTSC